MKTINFLAALATVLLATSVQAAPVFYNGHYYDRINSSLLWSQARDAATATSHLGAQGHLVTIMTEEENDFVDSVRNGGDCWIGANDLDVEGEWRWVTGELFWTGGQGGSVVEGMFEAWNNGEPNNAGGDEHGVHMFASGSNGWNDLHVVSSRGCYLVEYDIESRPVPTLGQIELGTLILLIGLFGWRATRPS